MRALSIGLGLCLGIALGASGGLLLKGANASAVRGTADEIAASTSHDCESNENVNGEKAALLEKSIQNIQKEASLKDQHLAELEAPPSTNHDNPTPIPLSL